MIDDDSDLVRLVRASLRAETAGVQTDLELLLATVRPQLRWRERAIAPVRAILTVTATALAVGVVLIVLLAAGTLRSATHRPLAPASRHHSFLPPHRGGEFVTVPTLSQLVAHFAVLRRAQTASDRAWSSPDGNPPSTHQLPEYTRLLARLHGHVQLFATVERFAAGGSLDQAAGTVSMSIWFVHPAGGADGFPYSPNVGSYAIRPISVEGRWLSVIPDGVNAVKWTFRCLQIDSQCRLARPSTTTVSVHNDLALLDGSQVSGCSGNSCIPSQVQWLRNHTIVRRFNERELELGNPQPFPLDPSGAG